MSELLVALTLDTEADHRGDVWRKRDPLTFDSVIHAIPEVLAPLSRELGVRPTYLLTTEVMSDPRCVETLRAQTDCELGTHLHGEHVAPHATSPAGQQSWAFTSAYPAEVERAKLETITRQFERAFDRAPISYRAGRYAASGRTARILGELGYRVDTSVTPGVRWVHEITPTDVLDFRHASPQPYHPTESDLARPGSLPIWEVPITITPAPLVQRVVGRLRRPDADPSVTWLRPSTTPLPLLAWSLARMLTTTPRTPIRVVNIMMHSMELVADASPYAPTQRDATTIAKRLRLLLRALEQLGARFATLGEIADALDRDR